MSKLLTIIVTALALLFTTNSTAKADFTVLDAVNARRSAIGLYSLSPDPTLQHWAEQKATMLANSRRSGHPYKGAWPGRREGTGNRSGTDPQGLNFYACNMATGYVTINGSRPFGAETYAGAAAVVRGSSTYYCIILR